MSELPASPSDQPVTKVDLAEFRTEVHDLLRQMTMWMVSAIIAGLVGGMATAAAVGVAAG